MSWIIATILVLLWGFGLVSGYTMGPFIHLLLVLAIFVVLVQVIQNRRHGKPALAPAGHIRHRIRILK